MSESVDEEMGNTHLLTNSSTHLPKTPIIQVKHLSKRYQIGMDRTYKTFRETVVTTIKSPLKRLKSFSRQEEVFWALKDINFEVFPGEVVGIIGRNGAGKSTLLKILSRITHPTEGEVILRGRVASLLEVGTGFHPELTGRENIYFNGSILGMTKQEIEDKFDEIVEFSGVKDFLDTPLKRYSSGMQVRLAFAVAAHLEPEILVVDEVLAVGDVSFQKKCVGKMSEVAEGGRTVLFVSHNMGAISTLCKRAIVLQQGAIVYNGNVQEAIGIYTNDPSLKKETEWIGETGDENVKLHHTWMKSLDPQGQFHTAADIEIGIEVEVLKPIEGLVLGFTLISERGFPLAYVLYDDNKEFPVEVVNPRKLIERFIIPSNTLEQGIYTIEFDLGIHMVNRIIRPEEGRLVFKLENISGFGRRFLSPTATGRFRPIWHL